QSILQTFQGLLEVPSGRLCFALCLIHSVHAALLTSREIARRVLGSVKPFILAARMLKYSPPPPTIAAATVHRMELSQKFPSRRAASPEMRKNVSGRMAQAKMAEKTTIRDDLRVTSEALSRISADAK